MQCVDAAHSYTSHTLRGLCVGHRHTGKLCETAKPIEMPFGEADTCGPREPCINWGPDPRREGAVLKGDMFRPIVKYRDYADAIRAFAKLPWPVVHIDK